jgi:hypothetical protein
VLSLALCECFTSLIVHLCAHLPSLHSHGNKRILMGTREIWWNCLGTWWEEKDTVGNKRNLMGTWWKQKGFDWNLLGTKRIWWELDGNKRNLMGISWELDENKRILMGYWWEQEEFDGSCLGTWWEIKPPHPIPSKNKKHPLGACWRTQLALLACFILKFFLGTNY